MNKFLISLKSVVRIVKTFPVVLIIVGLVGLVASVAISEEKLALIRHPDQALVCDLNPVYSCGKIIDSSSSKLFGFSNEIVGIIMFSVLIATGVMMLAGAKPKNWYWKLFLLGMIGFMMSVLWFFYQSVYVIGNLCVLCSTVWVCGWTITTRGFAWMYDQKLLPAKGLDSKLMAAKRRNIIGIWVLPIIIAAGLILTHFWSYYSRYFS